MSSQGLIATPSATVGSASSNASPITTFKARDRSLKAIGAVIRAGQDALLADSGGQWLWICPQRDRWAASIQHPARFHQHRSDELKVLPGAKCPLAPDEPAQWRPIDELRWTSAFYASQGLLLDSCQRHDVIELKTWPNFTRLPHTPGMLLLATYFQTQPSSLSLAHRLLKLSREEAFSFYSAASHAGYLRKHGGIGSGASAEPPQQAETGSAGGQRSGLWSRLLARFSRL